MQGFSSDLKTDKIHGSCIFGTVLAVLIMHKAAIRTRRDGERRRQIWGE